MRGVVIVSARNDWGGGVILLAVEETDIFEFRVTGLLTIIK